MTNSSSNPPVIQIPLTRGYVAIVDEVDSDLQSAKWYCHSKGYAVRNKTDKKGVQSTLKMHRVILCRILGREISSHEMCDHRNRDPLDNRRCNLRLATIGENNRNVVARRDGTSGYKGVTHTKNRKGWRAQINVNGLKIALGSYPDIKDAARAYNEAALKYHGEFARLNSIPDSE